MPRNHLYLRLALGAVCALALVTTFCLWPAGPAASAQTAPRWVKQSPLPSAANEFRDVEMISATEGWAVDNFSIIMHTTDGGATWELQNGGQRTSATVLHFKDALHGWAIGDAPLYTTDGGRTWNRGNGSFISMGSLACADLNVCVAARNQSSVFRTTDGGRNWTQVPVPVTAGRVQFFDERNGVAGGSTGVMRTADAGQTWTVWAQTHGGQFINMDEGFRVSGNTAERTKDGGKTWQSSPLPAGMWAHTYFFSDALNGWAAGGAGTTGPNIVRTTDGGLTWTVSDTGPNGQGPFWDIDFGDSQHGVAVGNCGVLMNTSDGGRTWTDQFNGRCGDVRGMDALDSQRAWAAVGDVLYTVDGGARWRRGVGAFNASDVDFYNESVGWATHGGESPYDDDITFKSVDGGRNWQQVALPKVVTQHGVSVQDENNIILVGSVYVAPTSGPVIMRTTDGGRTWTDVPHPFRNYTRYSFYGVHFVSPMTGWAVGDSGMVIKTTDGGATWVDQTPIENSYPVVEDVLDVSFADPNNGWIVGFGGFVFRTTDGGRTWARQNPGTQYAVIGVHALSPSTAWISGYGIPGFAARTTDGGQTWQREHPDVGDPYANEVSSFSGVYFLDAENGWVGGRGIFRRNGAALPPNVNLTSPRSGAVYSTLDHVVLAATATGGSASVTRVDFYSGETLIGSDAAAPYQIVWANPPAGGHALTARAADASGATATSPVVPVNVNAPQTYSISGRVADGLTNVGVGDVTVSLTGSAAATAVTNSIGEYVFANLPAGGGYTVTPSHAAYDFTPASQTYAGLSASQSQEFKAYRKPLPPGSVLISEFRLRGPNGSNDEFVELYNNTNKDITVYTPDGSPGWALAAFHTFGGETYASTIFYVPNGKVIPARGHYLATHERGFSLAAQAAADWRYSADITDDTGLALFHTQYWSQPNAPRLDAVGFTALAGADAARFREGAGLEPVPNAVGANEQYSFSRRLTGGTPQDTDDNAEDFILLSASGTVGGTPARLGTPGPENLSSPVQRNSLVKSSLIDPRAASTSAPNRVRDTADTGALKTFGTMSIRRKFTNKTGKPITRLRFRIVDVTTLDPSAAATASDMRALSSADVSVGVSGGVAAVRGTTLEQAPSHPAGGGLHSTLSAGTVSLSTPLAAGASINVQFLLGVERTGTFRFFINVEAAH